MSIFPEQDVSGHRHILLLPKYTLGPDMQVLGLCIYVLFTLTIRDLKVCLAASIF
jgi:hypothetical protein